MGRAGLTLKLVRAGIAETICKSSIQQGSCGSVLRISIAGTGICVDGASAWAAFRRPGTVSVPNFIGQKRYKTVKGHNSDACGHGAR